MLLPVLLPSPPCLVSRLHILRDTASISEPALANTTPKASTLPPPDAGLKLKHIVLGFGVQNYSCDTVGAKAVSKGALAVLYDVTSLYPGQSADSLSLEQFGALTTNILHGNKNPVNLTETTNRVDAAFPGASATNPFLAPESPVSIAGLKAPLQILGHHFFDTNSVPRFVVTDGSIVASKNATFDAPATSDPGLESTGAVAWLKLTAIAGSQGITNVYRVFTAGGNAHPCKAIGLDTVAYAAHYYLY